MLSKPIPADPELAVLVDKARGHKMTLAEREAQKRSFAGQTADREGEPTMAEWRVLDAIRAGTWKAVPVEPLAWECLNAAYCFRAPAPLFGSIRVQRYSEDSRWRVDWSVSGAEGTLIEGEWPDADAAKRAVAALLGAAPPETGDPNGAC